MAINGRKRNDDYIFVSRKKIDLRDSWSSFVRRIEEKNRNRKREERKSLVYVQDLNRDPRSRDEFRLKSWSFSPLSFRFIPGSFSFHNLLGEVMYSLFFFVSPFFERAHNKSLLSFKCFLLLPDPERSMPWPHPGHGYRCPIITLGHCLGDHGHFWAIDRFLPKLVNDISNGRQPIRRHRWPNYHPWTLSWWPWPLLGHRPISIKLSI